MKKVGELSDDLMKMEVKNRNLIAEFEQAKQTEQHIAKTYEDQLEVGNTSEL